MPTLARTDERHAADEHQAHRPGDPYKLENLGLVPRRVVEAADETAELVCMHG